MMTIILHAIAAVLWALALFFMGGAGVAIGQNDRKVPKVFLVPVAILAVTAFSLQVVV